MAVFVSTRGVDDDACGTMSAPCQTIPYALEMVTSERPHVYIQSGTYTEDTSCGFIPSRAATAGRAGEPSSSCGNGVTGKGGCGGAPEQAGQNGGIGAGGEQHGKGGGAGAGGSGATSAQRGTDGAPGSVGTIW